MTKNFLEELEDIKDKLDECYQSIHTSIQIQSVILLAVIAIFVFVLVMFVRG